MSVRLFAQLFATLAQLFQAAPRSLQLLFLGQPLLGRNQRVTGRRSGFLVGLDQHVQAGFAGTRLENLVRALFQRREHAANAAPAGAGVEQALADVAAIFEQRVTRALQAFVIEPEQPLEQLRVDAAQE